MEAEKCQIFKTFYVTIFVVKSISFQLLLRFMCSDSRFGNSAVYSVELVLLNKPQIWGGPAKLHWYHEYNTAHLSGADGWLASSVCRCELSCLSKERAAQTQRTSIAFITSYTYW